MINFKDSLIKSAEKWWWKCFYYFWDNVWFRLSHCLRGNCARIRVNWNECPSFFPFIIWLLSFSHSLNRQFPPLCCFSSSSFTPFPVVDELVSIKKYARMLAAAFSHAFRSPFTASHQQMTAANLQSEGKGWRGGMKANKKKESNRVLVPTKSIYSKKGRKGKWRKGSAWNWAIICKWWGRRVYFIKGKYYLARKISQNYGRINSDSASFKMDEIKLRILKQSKWKSEEILTLKKK